MPQVDEQYLEDDSLHILSEQEFDSSDQRFLTSQAMDGELSQEVDSNLDMLAYEQWDLYHLVGDALRSDDLVSTVPPGSLTAKVHQALVDEPTYLAPNLKKNKFSKKVAVQKSYGKWVASVSAVAAAVVLTFVLLPKNPTATSATEPLRFTADAELLTPFISAHRSFVGFSPYRQPVVVKSNNS